MVEPSPLLRNGILQTVYSLSTTKSIRVGFFPTHLSGGYQLLVRLEHVSVTIHLEHEEFLGLVKHCVSVSECLERQKKLIIYISESLLIQTNAKGAVLRNLSSHSAITFDLATWKRLRKVQQAVLFKLDQLYERSLTIQNYISRTIHMGTFQPVHQDHSELTVDEGTQIYLELEIHGYRMI